MSKTKTVWAVGRDVIEAQIETLTNERNEFHKQANTQIIIYNSKIEALKELLEPQAQEDDAVIE